MTSPAMHDPPQTQDPREQHERGWRSRTDVFRHEALAHHAGHQGEGEVLKISPRWTGPAYWTLVAALVVGAVYAAVGTVHEYAAGPAIVRLEAKNSLTAKAPGIVQTVFVQPRRRVKPGDLLVELSSADESANGDAREKRGVGVAALVRAFESPASEAVDRGGIGRIG